MPLKILSVVMPFLAGILFLFFPQMMAGKNDLSLPENRRMKKALTFAGIMMLISGALSLSSILL